MLENVINETKRSGSVLVLAVLLAGFNGARANELPTLDCVIEPYEVIEVSSAAEGVLERVYVERSDLVTRGQIVAELESDVEKASLAYAQFNASLISEIKVRRASLEFDERNHQRVEELYTKKAIPLHHKDEAQTDAAKSRWLLTKAEEDKRLAALEYARASAVLKRKTVRSPISGVVIARHKSTGEYIEDQAIITVAQLHPLRVDVIAPVELFGVLEKGMHAEITPELVGPGPLAATVMSVDRVIDGESGTFDVRLELPNPDYAIPSGLKCQVAFTAAPPAVDVEPESTQPPAPTPADLEPLPPRAKQDGVLREAAKASREAVRTAAPTVPNGKQLPRVVDLAASAPEQIPQPLIDEPPADGELDASVRDDTAAKSVPVLAEPAAVPVMSPAEPVAADGERACRVIGPFKTTAQAQRVTSLVELPESKTTPVERREEVVHSYILATPPTSDRAARDAIAAQIAEHGIKDTALLYKGSMKHRYSFGVYNNKVVAAVKQRSLQRLGFDIELMPRKREETRWWLEVVAANDERNLDRLLGEVNAQVKLDVVVEPCARQTPSFGDSAHAIAVAPAE